VTEAAGAPDRGQQLRVLCLEDEPADAELSILELRRAGYGAEYQIVSDREGFRQQLAGADFDIILADYRLPGWTGLDALRLLQETGKEIPFILVTGTLADETAVECVKQGVWDYVIKQRLVRLPFAVTRALRTRDFQRERAAAEGERERLVLDLAERERKYRELFELANDAILIFEPEQETVLEANAHACELYGFTREQLVGKSLKALTRDVSRGEQQIADLLRAGRWNNFETVHYRADGSALDILANLKVIDYGGRPAILTVNRDISELKRAQEALWRANDELERRVEERTAELARVNVELTRARDEWQSTFDCMSDAITVQDASFNIVRSNRAFREMFPAADPRRVKCYELVHGTAEPPENCPLLRTLASRRSEICESFEPHLDQYISMRADPVFDADGKLVRIVHAITNITERKEIERMKSDFVSTVSHELRTPLTSLRGFVELMLKREYSPEKRRHFLEVMHRETERLANLVTDVLDLQRIESGRQVFRFEPVSLAEVVHNAADLFAGAGAGHTIEAEIPDDIPLVFADPEMVRQVISNLVSNALKYSPEGGSVRVGARTERGEVLVWVSDEGIGIAPELLCKIFSRFYRVDNTETRQIGGTGLGLALVKDIVEAHGGRVWAESAPQKGSTFYFTLRFAQPERETTAA